MKYTIVKNSTGVIIPVYAQDLNSLTADGLSGITPSYSGIKAYYKKNTDPSVISLNLVQGTVGTYIASGIVAVSDTVAPGDLEFCLPNSAFVAPASGNYFLTATIKAANMLPIKIDIQLVDPTSNSSGGGTGGAYTVNEPSSVPTFPTTSDAALGWLLNRATAIEKNTATQAQICKRDGTVIGTATLSDDGSQLIRGNFS